MRPTEPKPPEDLRIALAALAAIRGRSGPVWLTSDTHFGHRAIVTGEPDRPGRRQYPDVEAMDRDLVARWNDRVRPHDTVIHLGDVAFGPLRLQRETLRQLVGHKILVRGNHDRDRDGRYHLMGFEHVVRSMRWGRLWLVHKPTEDRVAPEGCALVLHGHVHGAWARHIDCINVGVDVRGMHPVSLHELSIDESLTEES